jgi:hypothetical protein
MVLDETTVHQPQNPKSITNSMYVHVQDFTVTDELPLAILKAFVPQVTKQTLGFHVFTYT